MLNSNISISASELFSENVEYSAYNSFRYGKVIFLYLRVPSSQVQNMGSLFTLNEAYRPSTGNAVLTVRENVLPYIDAGSLWISRENGVATLYITHTAGTDIWVYGSWIIRNL